MKLLTDRIPLALKGTLSLRMFGLLKIPMIFFVSPSVVELNSQRCVIRIPLTWRTKNHLNSMYFGALCTGADCAGGLLAMSAIKNSGGSISLVFKDVSAEFLKRVEDDVFFTCEDGEQIEAVIRKALQTGERENLTIRITATVPNQFNQEPVAEFRLTLSVKEH